MSSHNPEYKDFTEENEFQDRVHRGFTKETVVNEGKLLKLVERYGITLPKRSTESWSIAVNERENYVNMCRSIVAKVEDLTISKEIDKSKELFLKYLSLVKNSSKVWNEWNNPELCKLFWNDCSMFEKYLRDKKEDE